MSAKTYLGDAVYAEFDGWHIWLTVNNGTGVTERIALEPKVMGALGEYHREIVTSVMREPVTNEELEEWAKLRADDAGHLARELVVARPLIQELVTALIHVRGLREQNRQNPEPLVEDALAKAKAMGFEP